MPRRRTTADEALIEALATREIEVTDRQLERWRQAGAIQATQRWRRGREGSEVSYPRWTEAQIRRLIPLLERYRSLPLAVLALFGGGHRVTESGLQSAYQRAYRDLAVAPWGSNWAKRSPIYQEWQIKGGTEAPSALLHTFQSGQSPSAGETRSIAVAGGVPPFQGLSSTLAELSAPALAAHVAESSLQTLKQARLDLIDLAEYLGPKHLAPPDDLETALLAPGLIPARQYLRGLGIPEDTPLSQIVRLLVDEGIALLDIPLIRPTLNDSDP